MIAYTTKTDAIAYEIVPALSGHEADYDLDAIFDETFRFDEFEHGFVAVEGVDFYEVAARHDISE